MLDGVLVTYLEFKFGNVDKEMLGRRRIVVKRECST